MTLVKLRYVNSFPDCQGKMRHYFRRHGRRVPLPGPAGSAEFMAAYQAALNNESPFPQERKTRGAAGTFGRLLQDYFESPDFTRLRASSQRAYKLAMERYIREADIGHRSVCNMKLQHVNVMLAKRAATPGAANDLLKKLRILIRFSILNGYRTDDPTFGVKKFAVGEFHTWTEEQIAQYEKWWETGTTERLALALLLYTGQRRSDVVRMSWADIVDGDWIRVVQQKTLTKLQLRLHPELKAILNQSPRQHLVVLATSFGKPFTAAGFGNWMADKIAAAGLPDECVTHGLRKAAARRLAEAGCSTLQIMSVTGHKSLKEVERYTREAQQRGLSEAAIGQLPKQR